MAASKHKTRFRLEQVKGGALLVEDNQASAMSIQSDEATNVKFLEVDTRNTQERIVLGDANAKVEIDGDLQIDGAVSGSQIGLGQGKLLLQANNTLADDDFLRIDGQGIEGLNAAEMRDQLSLDTDDTVQFTAIELGHASDNTLTASSGDLSIEGNIIYRAGGTDVPVADGGTGLSAISKGSVLVANTVNTLSALDGGGSASSLLHYNHANDTVSWKPHGRADTNSIIVDGSANAPLDNDYAKWTATGLEGMSFAEVLSDLSGAATADFSINTRRITNLADPQDSSDAVNKRYVDSTLEGLSHKASVKVKTVGAILGHSNSYVDNFTSLPTSNDIKDISGFNAVTQYQLDGRSGIRLVDPTSGNYDGQDKLQALNAEFDSIGSSMQRGDRVLVAAESSANDQLHYAAHGIYEIIHTGADTAQAPSWEIDFQGLIGQIRENDYIEFMIFEEKNSIDGSGSGTGGGDQMESNMRHRFRIGFKNGSASDGAFGVKGGAPMKVQGVMCAQLRLDGGQTDADLATDLRALIINLAGVANGNPFQNMTAVISGGANTKVTITNGQGGSATQDHDFYVEGTQIFMGSEGKGADLTVKQFAPAGMSMILARTEDADGANESGTFGELDGGAFVFVTHGTANANCGFVMSSDAAFAEGNTLQQGPRMEWTQFSSSGTITAADGIEFNPGVALQLRMNIESLTDVAAPLQVNDALPFMDISDAGNDSKRILISEMLNGFAGVGISRNAAALDVDSSLTHVVAVGALDTGSITSGFGSIDVGTDPISTTGLISGGSLDIDDVLIEGANIGHTNDTDLMTLANGILTVAGELVCTTLQIGNDDVTASALELNLLDAGVTTDNITIVDTDNIIIFDDSDGDVAKKIQAVDLKAFVSGGVEKAHCTFSGGGLAEDAAWNPGTNGMVAFPGGFSADNGDKTELYLNGMLLLRGASQNQEDYYNDSGSLKFNFDLEEGDVVQFVKRA